MIFHFLNASNEQSSSANGAQLGGSKRIVQKQRR
jgi:hypothetical protein